MPDLYEVCYQEDGTIASITTKEGAPAKCASASSGIWKRCFSLKCFIVPYIDIVHDRAMLEVMRGCIPRVPVLPGGLYLPA